MAPIRTGGRLDELDRLFLGGLRLAAVLLEGGAAIEATAKKLPYVAGF